MSPELRDVALREIGCIVAKMRGVGFIPGTKHHLLTTGMHGNGKRRGEKFTVLLSDWSHQGRVLPGWTFEDCYRELGPSYHHHAREFRDLYPDNLLLEETEKALAEWRARNV